MTTVVIEKKGSSEVSFCNLKPGQFYTNDGKLYCKPHGGLKDEIFDVAEGRLRKIAHPAVQCRPVSTITVGYC